MSSWNICTQIDFYDCPLQVSEISQSKKAHGLLYSMNMSEICLWNLSQNCDYTDFYRNNRI